MMVKFGNGTVKPSREAAVLIATEQAREYFALLAALRAERVLIATDLVPSVLNNPLLPGPLRARLLSGGELTLADLGSLESVYLSADPLRRALSRVPIVSLAVRSGVGSFGSFLWRSLGGSLGVASGWLVFQEAFYQIASVLAWASDMDAAWISRPLAVPSGSTPASLVASLRRLLDEASAVAEIRRGLGDNGERDHHGVWVFLRDLTARIRSEVADVNSRHYELTGWSATSVLLE